MQRQRDVCQQNSLVHTVHSCLAEGKQAERTPAASRRRSDVQNSHARLSNRAGRTTAHGTQPLRRRRPGGATWRHGAPGQRRRRGACPPAHAPSRGRANSRPPHAALELVHDRPEREDNRVVLCGACSRWLRLGWVAQAEVSRTMLGKLSKAAPGACLSWYHQSVLAPS